MKVWQKCPKCDGQGAVSRPPYLPADVREYSSSSTSFVCDVCNGTKIIQTPDSYININDLIVENP